MNDAVLVSELINLILVIPQLFQHPRQFSLICGAILRPTDSFVQSWRSTYENLPVLVLRFER